MPPVGVASHTSGRVDSLGVGGGLGLIYEADIAEVVTSVTLPIHPNRASETLNKMHLFYDVRLSVRIILRNGANFILSSPREGAADLSRTERESRRKVGCSVGGKPD